MPVSIRTAALFLLLLQSSSLLAQQTVWRGQPVQAYIESLDARGVNVIFSSDLLSGEMLIITEPSTSVVESALSEMLAPHGLALREDAAGRLMVVRADCPPGRLRIRVVDRLSLFGIDQAEVSLPDGRRLATDVDGYLQVRCLNVGEVAISVEASDYSRASGTVALAAGATVSMEFLLDLDEEPLTEIIVSSSVYTLNYAAAGSHTFLERELTTRLPDLGDEALRAIERLPGTAGDGLSSKTHVRGGVDSEQLISLDGLRLYEPFHLKDFLSFSSVIDQRAIAGIDFYSAGYPARYGDRMSGVIDISLRDPPTENVTELGISFFNTSALSTGRFNSRAKGDWLVSARRGNLDLLTRALGPEYGSPRTEDLLGHLGFEIGDRLYVSANLLASFDKITLADGSGVEEARARYTNIVGWLKAEVDWSDRLQSDTLLSITDIANERRGEVNNPGIVAGSVDDNRDFQVIALKQNVNFQLNDRWSLHAGVDIKGMQASYAYRSERRIEAPFDSLLDNTSFRQVDIEISPDGNQYAGIAEARWRPLERLVLDIGLRWDRQTYTEAKNDEQISPRLNALYDLGERTSLRLSAGRFHQAQEINELQIVDGVQDYYPASRANHYVLGLVHDFASGIEFKIEVYRKDYHALVPRYENILDPVVLLPDLQVDRTLINATRALAEGAEFMVSSEPEDTSVRWWVSYAWSQVRDKRSSGFVPRGWDQTHTAKGGINWDWRRWSFSAAGTVHTGWPRTRILVTTVPDGSGGSSFDIALGPQNEARYSVFHSLDFRASRNIDVSIGDLKAFVEITNLYNRQNPCCTEFIRSTDASGNDVLSLKNENWLPLVPSIGVLWSF